MPSGCRWRRADSNYHRRSERLLKAPLCPAPSMTPTCPTAPISNVASCGGLPSDGMMCSGEELLPEGIRLPRRRGLRHSDPAGRLDSRHRHAGSPGPERCDYRFLHPFQPSRLQQRAGHRQRGGCGLKRRIPYAGSFLPGPRAATSRTA